jgi:hypothetical protein
LGAVSLACAGLVIGKVPLELIIGPHIALTETYTTQAVSAPSATSGFRITRFFLIFCEYFFLLNFPPTAWVPASFWLAGIVVCLLAYGAHLYRQRRSLDKRDWDFVLFDASGAALVLLAFDAHSVGVVDLIFYHLLWWALYPLAGTSIKGLKDSTIYVVSTVAATAFFYALMPRSGFLTTATTADWYRWAAFWAYIHILSSIPLSKYNPRWLTRHFLPLRRDPC